MANRTVIMDGSNPNKENKERLKVVNTIRFKNELAKGKQQQQKKVGVLRNIALMAGGVGLASVMMSFKPSKPEGFDEDAPILVPEEPQQAVGVNDQMNYGEAWDVAREEVGAGGYFVWQNQPFSTYTLEEWNSLDEQDQQEFEQDMKQDFNENIVLEQQQHNVTFVVHDVAPVAESVSDDMSFGDAFAMARQEVGAGGVFEWNGSHYNTYYKEEWDAMTKEDQQDFANSYENTASIAQVQQPEEEQIPEAIVVDNNTAEILIKDEMVTTADGTQVHVGYFKQGDEVVIKIDTDNDNRYDYIADPETNQLIGLNGNQDVDLNQVTQTDAVTPLMSETTKIEGYDALVTIYSDGTQDAQIDVDGDGTYDTKLTVDNNGKVEVYDNTGQLIAEQQIAQQNVAEQAIHNSEEVNHQLIDDQLASDFGDDFQNNGDVSDWINDDLV